MRYSEIKITLTKALPCVGFSYLKEIMLCSLLVFYTTKLQITEAFHHSASCTLTIPLRA